ncbi:protein translocase subunit SecA-like [Odontesthes bonariensis]|uniref:protein translocase subunit SecA-like n=1 Tax=Odontesthes bonariensis TaxID=219752 RepID=UPI003F58D870
MAENDRDSNISLFDRHQTLHITESLLSANNEEEVLQKLRGLVTNIKWSPDDVSVLFDALLKRFKSASANNNSHLFNWLMQMLHCIEVNYITSGWRSKSRKTLRELLQDKNVTDEELKECLAKDEEKTLDEIIEEIRCEKLNQVDEKLLKDVKDIVSSVDETLTTHNDGSQQSELKQALRRICEAVQKTAKYRPRLTQMVSWCLMALSSTTGRLIQVGTGEGKSYIVAMFAAFRAMEGDKVDIMSSSSVLAQRDLAEWEEFYKELKISVDCNISKDDAALKKCYECQVVYGTVEEFAGDWLRHHFHRMDIFGKRTFQCAIVDEVDSLMLDKGHHVVYLSSEMPALRHLNPLLAFIWATVNQYSKISGATTAGRKYPFHQVVSEHIKEKNVDEFALLQLAEEAGVLPKGSVREIRREPNLFTVKTAKVTNDNLAEFIRTIETKFPSCQFALHSMSRNGEIKELNKRPQGENGQRRVPLLLMEGGFCKYMYPDKSSRLKAAEEEIRAALRFTPCDLKDSDSLCYIPGFLSDLVQLKLKVWIENAFDAQTMQTGQEYVLETHGIVPVDYKCTGVVENFMQWSDGLHQFLEMKHGFKLNDVTAITNYMSNVSLLQKYGSQIYGMSGTLGQQAETETLQKIYEGIQTCQIPYFVRRKLFEVEGVVAIDANEWVQKICDVVAEQTKTKPYRSQRAVLVICETIKRANTLHRALGDKVPQKTLYVNNNMDNRAIFAKNLGPGDVIIATNLAGRGTDLKVSDSVKMGGGLFVVQTFLPTNARVEAQAFGRAARQGSPGSAQLIVCSSHLPEPLQQLVLTRKLLSVFDEMTNITSFKQYAFGIHFRQYVKSYTDDKRKRLSGLLSHILTEKSDSDIMMAKRLRNDSVDEALSSYSETHIPNMKKKEELFSQYLEVLDGLYKSHNNKPAESDVAALNEFWGMWLLTKFNEKDPVHTLKHSLKEDLNKAMQKLRKGKSPLSNLHNYIIYGSELQKTGKLSESIDMYTKAIKEDHCWAAVAFYNRAFAWLTQQNEHQDPDCINRALEDLQNALKSVELYCKQLKVTSTYGTQQTNDLTRFDHHIAARHTVLESFKANISEAIQKLQRARNRGGYVKVEEKLVFFLTSAEHILPLVLLTIPSVRVTLSRDLLGSHQLISHPLFDVFNELRSLEAQGLTNIYVLDTLFSLSGLFSKIARMVRS